MASVSGDMQIVELLIESNAILNAIDKEGQNAIHIAAAEGHAPIIHLLTNACKIRLF